MNPAAHSAGYRPDIDGLRAVAVLAVVLYHAGVPFLGGGFVGVDIFFVISGYLITSIIAREIQTGTFSIAAFYERRTRRIFPALFAMLAASLVAALFIQLPDELAEFGRSLAAATLFVSNIFFWQTADYFGGPAHLKPLLHTWSLAVEEQFYIVFPLLLLAIARWARGRYVAMLLPLALASLAIAIWAVAAKPSAAFYLLPSRFWELMMGALLALGAVPPIRSVEGRHIAGALGLALIGVALAGYSSATAFPGLAAMVPCLGAALIIHAGASGVQDGLAARLLGRPPLVFFGLISYSLYLWHWPVFAFSRQAHGEALAGSTLALLVLLSVALAIASWRFVELPFRERRVGRDRPALFRWAAFGMAATLAFGVWADREGGWPSRHPGYNPPQIAGISHMRLSQCFLADDQRAEAWNGQAACSTGPLRAPKVFVWGDSFAAHLIPGLERRSRGAFQVIQYTAGGCPPIVGLAPANRPHCQAFNDRALRLIEDLKPDVVLLSARWESYLPRLAKPDALVQSVRAVRALHARAVIVGDSPTFDFANPYDYVYRTEQTFARPARADGAGAEVLRRAFAGDRAVAIFDPMNVLCPAGPCPLKAGADYLYFDGGHLSVTGSGVVAEALLPMLVPSQSGPALSAANP